jgi:hypothetical protein
MEQFIDACAARVSIEYHFFAYGRRQFGFRAARMSSGSMQDAGPDSTEVDLGLHAVACGRLCRSSACSLGPASIVALVTAVAWLVLAWELAYNMPAVHEHEHKKQSECSELSEAHSSPLHSQAVIGVTNLEMADLQGASQEYYERFSPRGQQQYQPPTIS